MFFACSSSIGYVTRGFRLVQLSVRVGSALVQQHANLEPDQGECMDKTNSTWIIRWSLYSTYSSYFNIWDLKLSEYHLKHQPGHCRWSSDWSTLSGQQIPALWWQEAIRTAHQGWRRPRTKMVDENLWTTNGWPSELQHTKSVLLCLAILVFQCISSRCHDVWITWSSHVMFCPIPMVCAWPSAQRRAGRRHAADKADCTPLASKLTTILLDSIVDNNSTAFVAVLFQKFTTPRPRCIWIKPEQTARTTRSASSIPL